MQRTRRNVVWFLVVQLGFLGFAQGCRQSEPVSPTAHGVTYVLEWKRAKAQPLPSAGFEVTNDLGFVVRVSRVHIVSRSVELIPCNPVPPAASLLPGLDSLLGPRPAFAGHSAIADPSATKTAIVESALWQEPLRLAPIALGAQTYCQAHYLIARADPQAVGLPSDVDMVDQTLRIEGTFQRPNGSTFEPFAVTTAVANGKLFELSTQLNTGSQSAVVVVRRNLDSIFDRVDFAAMNEKRIAREILQNLIDGAEIDVRVNEDAR